MAVLPAPMKSLPCIISSSLSSCETDSIICILKMWNPKYREVPCPGSQGDEVAKSGSKLKQLTFSPYACCNSAVSGPEGTCVGWREESGEWEIGSGAWISPGRQMQGAYKWGLKKAAQYSWNSDSLSIFPKFKWNWKCKMNFPPNKF